MKKVSALLLTGIIGTSMLFADFTGTATLTNTLVDLDSHEFGFTNATEFDAEVELYATTMEAMGEGDIYAEIGATLTLTTNAIDELTDSSDDVVGYDESDNVTVLEDMKFTADPSFDYANIVGNGWKLSILSASDPVDYAADTIALDGDDEAYNYSVVGTTFAGTALTLDDLGTVSVGYTGDFDAIKDTQGYFAFETTEMEVSEGMTAQVGASIAVDRNMTNKVEAAGSAMLAYASDDYSASVALDAAYDANGFGMDAVLNSTMKFVTLDAYYGSSNENDDFNDDPDDLADISTSDDMLNVKAVVDLADLDVPASLTLTGLDLINIQDLDGKVSYSVTDELTPYVSGGYVLDSKVWTVGAGVEYAVDAYTACADVSYTKGNILAASASIESTTLVDGATLTLSWDDADDLLDNAGVATDPNYGSVSVACEIAF